MAPPSADIDNTTSFSLISSKTITSTVSGEEISSLTEFPKPLKYSGSLDGYKSFDSTPVIGREYPEAQLTEILQDDEKIRDLAIMVSQRGVVFFRSQDITLEQQKILAHKLGEFTGKPTTSKLLKHPFANSKNQDNDGKPDDEVAVLDSVQNMKYYKGRFDPKTRKSGNDNWHTDTSYEPVPPTYAVLKINELPETGGDTLWASGYEAYDRLSPAWQNFLDGLTGTHYQPAIKETVEAHGVELLKGPRGCPENVGYDFQATHPVIRTNPVTGWKSIFASGHQIRHGWINDVTQRESDIIKAYLLELITGSHDLQVRFKWNRNDVAIWDNRSVFHTATADYDGIRQGKRVASLGERPYFDPKSMSRREALAK